MTDVPFRLAVGYDNPAGLQELTGMILSGDIHPFPAFHVFGSYNPGLAVILPNNIVTYDGTPTIKPIASWISYMQVKYLSDTYCNGGYGGQVTAEIVTQTPHVGEYWNCTLQLPPPAMSRDFIPGYTDYTITLFLEEQLIDVGALLLETDDYLLTQTGVHLLLES